MLETAGFLAPRGLHVEAPGGTMVRAPHGPPFLLPRLSVNGLAIAPVLRAVSIQDVHHVFQAVSSAKPIPVKHTSNKARS